MSFLHLKNGLREIFNNYDAFLIDIWGVLHNGVSLNSGAIEVLDNLRKNNKKFVLITNAPRPKKSVSKFLTKLNLNKIYYQNIFTSGDAALNSLKTNLHGKSFFHLGPKRDMDLFYEFKDKRRDTIDLAEFILCTGLFDDNENDLSYYKNLLKKKINKKMVCTNPDLFVNRGIKKEYCAGSIAKIFEEMEGKVIYYGKPYPEIYESCIQDEQKILVIGDNLNTDIKGANNMFYDSLFIKKGIHLDEFKNLKEEDFDKILNKYKVKINYYQNHLFW
tara:strand:+ start:1538 stop:2362 length:825 start_codon:yes stop_codon:yes gene_type:complete